MTKTKQGKPPKVPLFQRNLNTQRPNGIAAVEVPSPLPPPPPTPPPPPSPQPITLKVNGRWKKSYLEKCWEKSGIKPITSTTRWDVSNKAYDPEDWINLPETVPEYVADSKANITAGAYIFTHRRLSFNNFEDYKKILSTGQLYELCILLIEPRSRCRFSIPKGHLNPGEQAHECAMREIYQETGIKLQLNSHSPYITFNKFSATQIMYLVYMPYELALRLRLQPQDTNEVRFAFWANLNFIQNNISFCNYTLIHTCRTTTTTNINPIIRFIMSNIGTDKTNENDPLNHSFMYRVNIYNNKYYMYELIERFIDAKLISIHTVWNRWPELKFW